MIVTLSPAKLLNFDSSISIDKHSDALFANEANGLIDILESVPQDEIAKLMKINPKQAFEVYQQIHSFRLKQSPSRQAGFTYNGIAFQGLNIKSFSDDDLDYAQNHLIIFSGLYGALRPLDLIKAYRLEMQTKLYNPKGTNLYEYWGETLTNYLAKRLKTDNKIWINLMSNEYTKVIDKKRLPKGIQTIVPDFKEQTSTGYRQVVVHTKKARGMMAQFILKNKIADTEHLKAFDEEGYSYSEQLSEGNNWVFVR